MLRYRRLLTLGLPVLLIFINDHKRGLLQRTCAGGSPFHQHRQPCMWLWLCCALLLLLLLLLPLQQLLLLSFLMRMRTHQVCMYARNCLLLMHGLLHIHGQRCIINVSGAVSRRHMLYSLCVGHSNRRRHMLNDKIPNNCGTHGLCILYHHGCTRINKCHGCLPLKVCKRPDGVGHAVEGQEFKSLGHCRRAAQQDGRCRRPNHAQVF